MTALVMTFADWLNALLRRLPAWPIYVIAAGWAFWLFGLALTGAFIEPIEVLEHRYGKVAMQLIVLGLAVSPIRRYLGINLMKFRRAIGVTAFFLLLAHFLVWAVLDVQTLGRVWADILERPYITVGMAGLLLFIPLGVTSNDLSIRRMGAAAWRRLHLLNYPASVLGAVHYLMQAKGFQMEPILYVAVILGLLALRLPVFRTARR